MRDLTRSSETAAENMANLFQFRVAGFIAACIGMFETTMPTRAAEQRPRPPNIVLVMPGAIGVGDLACIGNPIVQTPEIDQFYRQSVRFTSFHVNPTDSATRAALLTGRHEFRSGVPDTKHGRERLRLNAVTLAQVLKSVGYATGVFGTWHLGDEPAYQPDMRGFDEVLIHGGERIGQPAAGSCGDLPGNSPFDSILLHNGKFLKTVGFSMDVFFSHAIEWMDEKLDAHIPFFACVMPNLGGDSTACLPEYERLYATKMPPKVAAFYGAVSNIDQNFGRFLGKLDEWGIAKDALVVFLSDRGGSAGTAIFNGGLRGTAGTPCEGGNRVPSFWRWPGGFTGGVDVAALTAVLDVFPTLVEIAGARVPGDVRSDGRSLLPLLRASASEWSDCTLFTHVGGWPRGAAQKSKFAGCCARNDRFALVNNSELYDLQTDPAQMRDIAADQPGEAEKLRAAFVAWWTEVERDFVNEAASEETVGSFQQRYLEQVRSTGPVDAPPF